MANVYRAYDPSINRVLAIKVLKREYCRNPEFTTRFLREARSVAQLRHPGIVAIFEVGQAGDLTFLVSEYVAGVTLADFLSGQKLNVRETAAVTAVLAEALQYAHSRGVVHRDIKPSNIMLENLTREAVQQGSQSDSLIGRLPRSGDDSRRSPRIMDFGLAKRDAGEVTMTQEGQVLGTPAYMSPEQACGDSHHVDGRSDIYSLGVVFYQLLSGELPFRGNQRMLLHQVIHDDPRSPRSLNDRVPRDLETICLKALAKEPARRYATAGEFAADLRAFLNGEPIRARPVGQLERAFRWCRRQPVLASAIAAASLSLALAALLGISFAVYQSQTATQLQIHADNLGRESERSKQLAKDKSDLAERERRAKESAIQAQQEETAAKVLAEQRRKTARLQAYATSTNLAQRSWENGSPRRALELLKLQIPGPDEEDLRGFEWYYLWRLCHNALESVKVPATVNRRTILLNKAGTELLIPLWKPHQAPSQPVDPTLPRIRIVGLEYPEGTPPKITVAVASANGERMAVGTATGQIYLCDLKNDQTSLLGSHGKSIEDLAIDSTGQIVVSAVQRTSVRVWNVADKSLKVELSKWEGPGAAQGFPVWRIALAPNDKYLAISGFDGNWQIWNLETAAVLAPMVHMSSIIPDLAFSPDSKQLALALFDRRVRIFDVATSGQLYFLSNEMSSGRGLAFSANGNQLAVAAAGGGLLWEPASGRKTGLDRASLSRIGYLSGGNRIFTVDTVAPHEISFWNAYPETGEPIGKWFVTSLGFFSKDNVVAVGHFSGCADVCAGDTRVLKAYEVKSVDGSTIYTSVAANGKLASVFANEIIVWDYYSGVEKKFPNPAATGVSSRPAQRARFTPDGQKLVLADPARQFEQLDIATGEVQKLAPQGVMFWAISPDGRQLATAPLKSGNIRIQDLKAGKPEGEPFELPGENQVTALAYSKDGTKLGCGRADGTVEIWSVELKKPLAQLIGHVNGVHDVAFSHDGRTIATAGLDMTVRLWQVDSGFELLVLRGHNEDVFCVAFSPDDTLLATGSGDRVSTWGGSAKLWRAPRTTEAPQE
jgi:serine/threonine protein kinase/WD40 repeat protein